MASCLFASLVNDEDGRGKSQHYQSAAACVSLDLCDKDIQQHLSFAKVYGEKVIDSEMKLILARAGKSISKVLFLYVKLILSLHTIYTNSQFPSNFKRGIYDRRLAQECNCMPTPSR